MNTKKLNINIKDCTKPTIHTKKKKRFLNNKQSIYLGHILKGYFEIIISDKCILNKIYNTIFFSF